MVTETLSLIVHALISTTGKITSVKLVLFQEEFGGMDKDILHLIIYIRRNQNMIEAVPLTLVAIGSSNAVTARSILADILQVVLADTLQGRRVVVVVEVATDQNLGVRRNGPDGVHCRQQAIGSL